MKRGVAEVSKHNLKVSLLAVVRTHQEKLSLTTTLTSSHGELLQVPPHCQELFLSYFLAYLPSHADISNQFRFFEVWLSSRCRIVGSFGFHLVSQ